MAAGLIAAGAEVGSGARLRPQQPPIFQPALMMGLHPQFQRSSLLPHPSSGPPTGLLKCPCSCRLGGFQTEPDLHRGRTTHSSHSGGTEIRRVMGFIRDPNHS